MKAVYDDVVSSSRILEMTAGCNYIHSEKLCYFAALGLLSKKQVLYMQLPPGSGKTWLCVLMAMYTAAKKEFTPVIATINEGLSAYMEKYLAEAGLAAIKHVKDTSLAQVLKKMRKQNQKPFVIYDEYYSRLKMQSLELDTAGHLSIVHTVGDDCKLAVVVGHYSKEFKKFLQERFASVDLGLCHDDIPAFYKAQAFDRVQAVCSSDKERLVERMLAEIEQTHKKDPVIVFLLDGIDSSVLKERFGDDCLVVKDVPTLLQLSKYAEDNAKGIVVLDRQFMIGVDVKFGTDAKVIIFTAEPGIPDREDLTQMIGRGNRAGGDYWADFF